MGVLSGIRPAAAILALGLCACAVGPDFKRPAPPADTGYGISPAPAGELPQRLISGMDIPAEWWTLFGSPPLNMMIDAGDWGLQSARPVVAALLDASVGSTAFLLRQILGERMIRVSPSLVANYAMDDPEAVDGLNSLANSFFENQLGAIKQPDGTNANLAEWLKKYWY